MRHWLQNILTRYSGLYYFFNGVFASAVVGCNPFDFYRN